MPATRSRHKKILLPTGIALLLFAGLFGMLKFSDIFHNSQESTQLSSQNQDRPSNQYSEETEKDYPTEENQETEAATGVNDKRASEVGSEFWVVNKSRPVEPKSYQPSDLVFPSVTLRVPGNETMKIRATPAKAIEKMFNDAEAAGYNPVFSSGFRSYSYQDNLYSSYVQSKGQSEADKISARPGYSEHQTGLAFDICNADECNLEQSFAETPLGKWVANNAHLYGFIVRYSLNKEHITGYQYEPWHLRYVGLDLANKIHSENTTLEEYFNLPAAPDYQ